MTPRRLLLVGVVAALLVPVLGIPGEAAHTDTRRYVTPGETPPPIVSRGTVCSTSLDFDVGGACSMPCGADRQCFVRVIDDLYPQVSWRACVHGESGCRGLIDNETAVVGNADQIDVIVFIPASAGTIVVR